MKFDLEKLRALPPHTRTQVAFASAFTVAGVIAIVWVTTLGGRFEEQPVLVKEEPRELSAEHAERKTWGEFVTSAGTQFGNIMSAFQSIKIELGSDDAVPVVEERNSSEVVESNATDTNLGTTTVQENAEGDSSRKVLIGTTTVKNSQ